MHKIFWPIVLLLQHERQKLLLLVLPVLLLECGYCSPAVHLPVHVPSHPAAAVPWLAALAPV